MLATCLPPRTRMMSKPGLPPKAMSGSMVLLQRRSILTSMTHVTTKAKGMPRVWVATSGHFGVPGLWCHWGT